VDYSILVTRKKREGTLAYQGSIALTTKCWWDLERKVPAGKYRFCSKTRMATKLSSSGDKREAIFIPDVPGYKGVFIHMGTGPKWSDGCVVIIESDLLKIWRDIIPEDGRNITVTIKDA
jgi:hypothetical protein